MLWEVAMEEYKHIQELRRLWSQFIMDWMRIGVPVGGAFFGFFSYLGQVTFSGESYSWLLPILGWSLFIKPMIMWRVVTHHIDRQIVEMYPRMLELERRLRWVSNTTYFYNNLRGRSRRLLENRLGVENGWLNNRNYRQFRQECERRRRNPYNLLLDIWDERGHRSVTSRGHIPQDYAVVTIIAITLFIALILSNLN